MTACPYLAVFDVDGTLIDSQNIIVGAMSAAFEANSLAAPPAEAIRSVIGLSLDDLVARLLPEADVTLHQAVARSYRDAFFTCRSAPNYGAPLFPGVREAFDRLEAAGWLLGVATGKSRRGLDAMIERHGFKGRFVTLQTADYNPGKPHPAMVLQAMAEAGSTSAHTVMIGDTSFDMEMARSAGARAAGVIWGYHPPEILEAAGAEILLEDFPALPAAVSALVGSL